jgi:hypothetical protein
MADHIDDPDETDVPDADRRRPRWVPVVAAAILVLLVAGLVAVLLMTRGDDGSVSTSPKSETVVPSSTTEPAPTTAAGPTAADTLAEFFVAAETMDAEVRAAADLVNEGTTDVLLLDAATLTAIQALDLNGPGYLLPAGLPPELLEKVLLVQSDLQSRALALHGLLQFGLTPTTPGTIPLDSDAGRGALACLRNGAEAAASFDADVDAAEATARALPAVVAQPPDSRAAEELALRLALIDMGNTGCAGCGGYRATTLVAISWTPPAIESPTGPWDGTIDGIPFRTTYLPGEGWQVRFNAC